MADIRPFKAWRYNDTLAQKICDLTSPLFDVASEKHKSALYCNPFNSIHLSIPRGDNPAQNAAAVFQKWKLEGCIQKDPAPGIYVYYQFFKLPGDTREYCRKGFICKIRIYDWEQNVILRHENTMPTTVHDQVELLNATGLNASPTHGLYIDEAFELDKFMEKSMQRPICETEDYQGIRDVLSVIRDPQTIQHFVNFMRSKQVILADGHHRYAGSLAYMKQKEAGNPSHTGKESYNYHLMWLTNTEGEDLKIMPTHRLIKGLDPFDQRAIMKKFEKNFIIKPISDPENLNEFIAGKKETFGLIFKDSAYVVVLKPDANRKIKWNFPDEVRSLDLTLMHYFIIQEILGIKGKDQLTTNCIEYERSFPACLTKVLMGDVQLALVTNEVSIGDVKCVCRSGCTLPQKSTYFWPKAICGFVFSSV